MTQNSIGISLRRLFLSLIPIIGVLIFWWLITAFVLQQGRIYPTPGDVSRTLVNLLNNVGDGPRGTPYQHAGATFVRLLVAWVCAFVPATLVGVLAGRCRALFDFLNSYVWVVMAVPSVVWVFIFLIVFGISNVVPILALVLLLSAPVFIGTAEGVRATPVDLIEMCDSYKIKRWHRLIGLYLPHIAPYMISNARVSFALGIKIVIIAEVVGLPNGIGLLVRYWSNSLYMAPIVAWGLILVVLGICVDHFVFSPIARLVRRDTATN